MMQSTVAWNWQQPLTCQGNDGVRLENLMCQMPAGTGYSFHNIHNGRWLGASVWKHMKIFTVAFIFTAVLCKFLKVPNEINKIHFYKTDPHSLVSEKLVTEAFRQKWNLLGKKQSEDSVINCGQKPIWWLGLRACPIGLLHSEWQGNLLRFSQGI